MLHASRIAALCALVLAGCATVPLEPVAPGAPSSDVAFEASGRFSARYGTDAVAGRFAWTHAPGLDTLVFATPTGQALARMTGSADGVRLELPDGRVETAGDWQALTTRALGVPIPVGGLAYWLRAVPRPGSPHAEERGADGRVSLLRQDGWEIVYGYADDGRPARLRMTYPDVELRLAMDPGS